MASVSALFLTVGLILLLASWIYLLIISFKDDFTWGLTTVFLPPLSYVYSCFAWHKAQAAVWLAGLGWLLILLSL